MPSYSLTVLGLEISFKTDADQKRVSEAKQLVEQRFQGLEERGRTLNREKLLTLIALSLADDSLQTKERITALDGRIERLIRKLDTLDLKPSD